MRAIESLKLKKGIKVMIFLNLSPLLPLCRRRLNSIKKASLHTSKQLILLQLLLDRHTDMLLKSRTSGIPLKEMKDVAIVLVSADAVVDDTWLRGGDPGSFRVHGL
jgi:hypothetical protein